MCTARVSDLIRLARALAARLLDEAHLLEHRQRRIDDARARRIAAAGQFLDRADEVVAVPRLLRNQLQEHQSQLAGFEHPPRPAAAAAAPALVAEVEVERTPVPAPPARARREHLDKITKPPRARSSAVHRRFGGHRRQGRDWRLAAVAVMTVMRHRFAPFRYVSD